MADSVNCKHASRLTATLYVSPVGARYNDHPLVPSGVPCTDVTVMLRLCVVAVMHARLSPTTLQKKHTGRLSLLVSLNLGANTLDFFSA